MRIRLMSCLAICAMVLSLGFVGADSLAEAAETVKIGAIYPLSGNLARLGEES
ncbi:MAG: hypothetical protein H5T92_04085, partial [Synergistales bacterium]|nr:hypothetical protein [Synergistales bacterium]